MMNLEEPSSNSFLSAVSRASVSIESATSTRATERKEENNLDSSQSISSFSLENRLNNAKGPEEDRTRNGVPNIADLIKRFRSAFACLLLFHSESTLFVDTQSLRPRVQGKECKAAFTNATHPKTGLFGAALDH